VLFSSLNNRKKQLSDGVNMIDTHVREDVDLADHPDFWKYHVSRDLGRDNLPENVWDRICKIRSMCIRLAENIVLGNPEKPHMVIPEGCKGYAIEYPEAFTLNEDEKREIEQRPRGSYPVTILGYEHILFLYPSQFRVAPPFFDGGLANMASMEARNAPCK
jgi:hypothetical protein